MYGIWPFGINNFFLGGGGVSCPELGVSYIAEACRGRGDFRVVIM